MTDNWIDPLTLMKEIGEAREVEYEQSAAERVSVTETFQDACDTAVFCLLKNENRDGIPISVSDIVGNHSAILRAMRKVRDLCDVHIKALEEFGRYDGQPEKIAGGADPAKVLREPTNN